MHQHQGCLVNQREVHQDTQSFSNALRAALREDPDIVLIGEMRDLETVESALRIAETGHLTLGTLHTNSAAQTINRIIDIFPAHQQSQIRTQLSLVLEAIVCQALLPKIGGGRVVSLEIMIPTRNPNLIREDKVHRSIPRCRPVRRRSDADGESNPLRRCIRRSWSRSICDVRLVQSR